MEERGDLYVRPDGVGGALTGGSLLNKGNNVALSPNPFHSSNILGLSLCLDLEQAEAAES